MLARKFLYIIAGLIVLTLGSGLAYRIWGQQMLAAVMVPHGAFVEPAPFSPEDYHRQDMWLARPDMPGENPALWLPGNAWKPVVPGKAAIFFVHPTSYLSPINKAHWNAPLNDQDSNKTARAFVSTQASALTAAGAVWAPRYRQAHFGTFLGGGEKAQKAMDAAYRDVASAFAAFLVANPQGPIILAGHSQGSMLLMRLMRDAVAGKPLADRIAAAYLVGWPVSLTADLPALGLPACSRADESGCIVSWQSFAEPADPTSVTDAYGRFPGMTGAPRAGTPMLCINPLTGTPNSSATASQNFGTLVPPEQTGTDVSLVLHSVPARCGTDAKTGGFLLIGDPPQMGPFTLPGNNYHVYDYALFWANIRLDATKRLTAFLSR